MLKTYFAVWASMIVLALFYIGHYVFGHDSAKIVVDSLVVGCGVTIFVNWFVASFRALRDGLRHGGDNIIVSIWMVWTVLLGYFVYVQYYNFDGRPEYLRLSPIGGTFSTMFFIAGAYAVLSPINTTQVIERISLMWWFIAVALGGIIAGGVMVATYAHILAGN